MKPPAWLLCCQTLRACPRGLVLPTCGTGTLCRPPAAGRTMGHTFRGRGFSSLVPEGHSTQVCLPQGHTAVTEPGFRQGLCPLLHPTPPPLHAGVWVSPSDPRGTEAHKAKPPQPPRPWGFTHQGAEAQLSPLLPSVPMDPPATLPAVQTPALPHAALPSCPSGLLLLL